VGEVTREEVIGILTKANPTRPDLVAMYADQFLAYQEAAANIAEVGNIAAHPRTAAPIVNPYIAVRDQARKAMIGMKQLRTAELWK
jgi:phage terminase small subunit